jgi:transposase
MLALNTVKRVCLVHNRVDFRMGHDGLLGESYRLGLAPYDGDLVIFVGRGRNTIKLLVFDGTGLWVLYKKFKSGSLRRQFRFMNEPAVSTVSINEVALLLAGVQYQVY